MRNTANNEEKPTFTVSAIRSTSSSRSRLPSSRPAGARKLGSNNSNIVTSTNASRVHNPRMVMNYAKKPDELDE